MNVLTALLAPGTGRRQGDPCERLRGHNARLRSRNRTLERQLRQTAYELGEAIHALLTEQANRRETQQLLRAALDVNAALDRATRPAPPAPSAPVEAAHIPARPPLAAVS